MKRLNKIQKTVAASLFAAQTPDRDHHETMEEIATRFVSAKPGTRRSADRINVVTWLTPQLPGHIGCRKAKGQDLWADALAIMVLEYKYTRWLTDKILEGGNYAQLVVSIDADGYLCINRE